MTRMWGMLDRLILTGSCKGHASLLAHTYFGKSRKEIYTYRVLKPIWLFHFIYDDFIERVLVFKMLSLICFIVHSYDSPTFSEKVETSIEIA